MKKQKSYLLAIKNWFNYRISVSKGMQPLQLQIESVADLVSDSTNCPRKIVWTS
jgi:hypothetical protein